MRKWLKSPHWWWALFLGTYIAVAVIEATGFKEFATALTGLGVLILALALFFVGWARFFGLITEGLRGHNRW